LADVQIFNQALNATQVSQIKNAPGSVTSGLIGYWPMMGGVTEGDRSGQANNGTITGTSVSSSGPTALTTVGGVTALTSQTITGNTISLLGATTTGAQSYTASGGAVTLNYTLNTTSNGNISVTAPGTITVANAITANGSGTVTLTATGSSSNITTSAAIDSGSGLISLLADNNVTLNSGGMA